LIGFFALASLGVLLAQISTGVIVGQVKDITGAVLADATVQIVNSATGLNQSVKTNSDGFYRSPDLPPGAYDILMAHPGFKSADVKGVTLQINQTARVDITAELGAVTEHVEVQSSAPLLQTETSSTGQVIQNQTIVNLPLNGRNYLDLTKLVPGVAQAQAGRGSWSGPYGWHPEYRVYPRLYNGQRSSSERFRGRRGPGLRRRQAS